MTFEPYSEDSIFVFMSDISSVERDLLGELLTERTGLPILDRGAQHLPRSTVDIVNISLSSLQALTSIAALWISIRAASKRHAPQAATSSSPHERVTRLATDIVYILLENGIELGADDLAQIIREVQESKTEIKIWLDGYQMEIRQKHEIFRVEGRMAPKYER